MRARKWENLSREEKLANIMFPHLASKQIQEEMKQLAANEGKKSPTLGRQEQISKSTKAK
jgi:hypothetical protein